MNEITGLLLNSFTTICLIIGLGIITITNKNFDKRTNRPFISFVLLVLVLVIADTADYYLAGFSEPSILRYIAAAAGYALRPASIAILIGILLRRKGSGVILWIPIILVGILAFTSCFTHLMFWFDDQNNFMRGPLGYISHVVSGIYSIVLIAMTIKMHRDITSGEVFAILYSAVICTVATVLESVLPDCKFLLTGAMITSCTLYYVVLYIETYKRDMLTGLMNRRSLYLDAKRMRRSSVAVVSIDLNGLKEINDALGHSAGDRALQSMSNAMHTKSGKQFLLYRVGGDEFIALGKEQTTEAVTTYIDDMRAALTADHLTASFGCAFYSSGDSFDDICNQADARMYDEKKQYKHRTTQRDTNNANAADNAR
ncbi:MAG: GGDEF domain-containing protein [Oscillospiraceae bacterium]|nr:GGDEF domain-containing protein [Oscillospiraceae bacterium]